MLLLDTSRPSDDRRFSIAVTGRKPGGDPWVQISLQMGFSSRTGPCPRIPITFSSPTFLLFTTFHGIHMTWSRSIGRLYRIGQTKAVELHALVSDTGVDRLLFEVFDNSLRMFSRQVGEVDAILGELDENFNFEAEVWKAFAGSANDIELASKFATIRIGDQKALEELANEDAFLRMMGLA